MRLIGVGVHNVTEEHLPLQMDLFEDGQKAAKNRKIEQTAFELSRKQGKKIITRARLLSNQKKDGCAEPE
ncbi:hypothetical protein [Brucepastera parasyntrophica]|uniref:hypothetical protein n=1 Tax=Brucepastera parasyntrophica TaxID=2880008 RepID=UPI0034E1AA84